MTGPKLLFDENLSFRLIKLLAESFPESVHTDDVGLWNYSGSYHKN